MPTISISTASVRDVEADVLILPLLAGQDDSPATVPGSSEISEAIASLEPSSARGDVHRIPSFSLAAAGSLLLVGVGASSLDEVEAEDLLLAYGAATRALTGVSTAALALPGGNAEQLAAAVEGAALGAYAFITHKSESSKAKPALESVVVLAEDETGATAAAERAEVLAGSVDIARDLVNTPPNLLYPAEFARRAEEAVADLPITVTVLDEKELAEGGYGGIVGVGQGSSRPPRLVRLEYAPEGAKQSVALVGKGITFDTGGISIKPAAGMEQMTMDMGGAAAVVATVILAARLGLDLTVVATVPMAENMPSATAYRPGDVLTMYGGTTVEVQNTDAEGRLILADAIVRACEDSPSYLIDTATLTGAQMVALGKKTPGVMGTDEFRDRVAELSRSVGEGGWPMPLPEELRDGLDSEVADMTNVTPNRWGGMLSAGLFLREFVGEGVEWAHIDVAGPAYNDGGPEGYLPKGGTGVPVRTMLAVLEDIAAAG